MLPIICMKCLLTWLLHGLMTNMSMYVKSGLFKYVHISITNEFTGAHWHVSVLSGITKWVAGHCSAWPRRDLSEVQPMGWTQHFRQEHGEKCHTIFAFLCFPWGVAALHPLLYSPTANNPSSHCCTSEGSDLAVGTCLEITLLTVVICTVPLCTFCALSFLPDDHDVLFSLRRIWSPVELSYQVLYQV